MTIHRMALLEALLAGIASPNVLLFNDASEMEVLHAELKNTLERMEQLQSAADNEKRELSEEEVEEFSALDERFERIKADIERRDRISAKRQALETGNGRQTEPDDVYNAADEDEHRHVPTSPRNQGNKRSRAVPAQPRNHEEERRHGFRGFGEFAIAVRQASHRSGGSVDNRLRIYNAPSTYGTEGTGGDGGFAVPPEFRREIMEKVMAEDSLLGRTDTINSMSNSITIPKDETTPWQTSGGIQVAWENEAGQLNQSKPSLEQTTVRLNKLTALVPVTEELLEDAPALSSYLSRKAPTKMDFKINDAIVNGTGAGQPLGILNSAALVTVDAESGQTADTVVFQNIVNMWSRLDRSCRANAIWLVNQDVEPSLLSMAFPGTGTAVPVYLPAGGLSNSPYSTLMGKPVIPTDACDTIGDVGDIILVDLKQYLSAVKSGGVRQDVSIHLFFDYDMTTFRFIFRVGGQPWWSSAITPKNSAATRSFAVALAARA